MKKDPKKVMMLEGYTDAQAKAINKAVSAQMGLSPAEIKKIKAREAAKKKVKKK